MKVGLWHRTHASIASKEVVRPLSTVTIRNLDAHVKRALQRRAAEHGRSMEAEARAIIADAVLPAGEGLVFEFMQAFQEYGGVDLEIPPREPASPALEFR